jgi:hypothetical protein
MMKVLALAALLATGCSAFLQPRPSKGTLGYAEQPCSTSSKYWIADALIAGLGTAALVGGRVYADSSPENEATAYSIAGLGAVLAVTYLASAGNGRAWVRECHERQSSAKTASR